MRYVLLLAWAFLAALPMSAQVQNPLLENPKYGPDRETREECLKQTSFYQEFYKQKNYKDARVGWAIAYNICPKSSQNLYIRGIRMLKMELDATTDEAQKKILVDSLMGIYDKRIQYFGRRGYNLQQKGIDLLGYAPNRTEEVAEILGESLELQREQFDAPAIPVLMQVNAQLFAEKKRTAEQMIELYAKLAENLSIQSQTAKDQEDQDKVKAIAEQLDAQFTSLGVANCADLVAIYTPKLDDRPKDLDLAKTICNQLSAMRCTDEDLYLRAAEVVFAAEPTTMLGLDLARSFAAKRKNPQAEEYFKRTIVLEKDSIRRSQMLVEYASFVSTNLGNMPQARTIAYEALSYNRNQGYAYMLIASLYAGTRNCGASKIDNASVYWAAVDKYQQAKSVDPALAQACNKQIAYLSQLFPLTEEIFFQDLQKGQAFTVPCWINEKTVIRARD